MFGPQCSCGGGPPGRRPRLDRATPPLADGRGRHADPGVLAQGRSAGRASACCPQVACSACGVLGGGDGSRRLDRPQSGLSNAVHLPSRLGHPRSARAGSSHLCMFGRQIHRFRIVCRNAGDSRCQLKELRVEMVPASPCVPGVAKGLAPGPIIVPKMCSSRSCGP